VGWVEIVNSAGTQTYAKCLSAALDTTTMDQSFSVTIYSDGGYFQLAWSLVGAQSNAALTCAQAGVSGGGEAVGTFSGTSSAATDIWDCEPGSGITDAYLHGNYTVSVSALGTSDQAIGKAPTIPTATIGNANAVTNLGTITIPIDYK
jgi:hypothetical protein